MKKIYFSRLYKLYNKITLLLDQSNQRESFTYLLTYLHSVTINLFNFSFNKIIIMAHDGFGAPNLNEVGTS